MYQCNLCCIFQICFGFDFEMDSRDVLSTAELWFLTVIGTPHSRRLLILFPWLPVWNARLTPFVARRRLLTRLLVLMTYSVPMDRQVCVLDASLVVVVLAGLGFVQLYVLIDQYAGSLLFSIKHFMLWDFKLPVCGGNGALFWG